MKFTIIPLFLLSLSTYSTADTVVIAENVKIIEIGSATGGKDNFHISVKGGTGVCANYSDEKIIVFPLSALDGNKEIHARTYSAVLAAFLEDLPVSVLSKKDLDCDNATAINIRK